MCTGVSSYVCTVDLVPQVIDHLGATVSLYVYRPNLSSLRDYLITELGGTEVVTEEQLYSREMQYIVKVSCYHIRAR